MSRRIVLALVAGLLLAGCGGGPPEVVFTAGGNTVTARPAQYCDQVLTECDNDATAPVELGVPAGTPLRIEVPDEVAQTPWVVVFGYVNGTGEQVQARGPLFAAGERTEYVLELPAPTDRLLTAQVQQLGAAPQVNPQTNEIEFPTRATWVLTVA